MAEPVTGGPRLLIAEIAARYGLSPATVRTYHGQATGRRRAGNSGENDFPPPIQRIGNTPLFDAEQVENWFTSRPGRGTGGGRPRKKVGDASAGMQPKRAH